MATHKTKQKVIMTWIPGYVSLSCNGAQASDKVMGLGSTLGTKLVDSGHAGILLTESFKT